MDTYMGIEKITLNGNAEKKNAAEDQMIHQGGRHSLYS